MVAITYGGARVAAPVAADTKAGKSFFKRVFDAISRAQMIRAQREIARYRHLLPPGFKLNIEDEPFGGW